MNNNDNNQQTMTLLSIVLTDTSTKSEHSYIFNVLHAPKWKQTQPLPTSSTT